jgi:hypothetical protein
LVTERIVDFSTSHNQRISLSDESTDDRLVFPPKSIPLSTGCLEFGERLSLAPFGASQFLFQQANAKLKIMRLRPAFREDYRLIKLATLVH